MFLARTNYYYLLSFSIHASHNHIRIHTILHAHKIMYVCVYLFICFIRFKFYIHIFCLFVYIVVVPLIRFYQLLFMSSTNWCRLSSFIIIAYYLYISKKKKQTNISTF